MRSPVAWLLSAMMLIPTMGRAWGPHGPITQAALDRLNHDGRLIKELGIYGPRLTNYCWLADYRRVPYAGVDEEFYAEDYLLFPGMTLHLDHLCPEVRKAYRPYMRRALQALRTENAANAARWVGSLLHFVEDTGSPPHAAEIGGPAHSKMENWVDARLIAIPGYNSHSLGFPDEDAIEGLERRMTGLIEFSKVRGERLRPLIEATNRVAAEPIVLESAMETSRVVADLLHTINHLMTSASTNSAGLRGTVNIRAGPAMERYPAKVVIMGTSYSTMADTNGGFEFRNLPAGKVQVRAWRGGTTLTREVALRPGETITCDLVSEQPYANLVRNPDFRAGWLAAPALDCWYPVKSGWEGEIIPLKTGQQYRLKVDFRPGAEASLAVVWTQQLPHTLQPYAALPKIEPKPLTRTNDVLVFTATEKTSLMQLTIRTPHRPEDVCERIQLVVDPKLAP
jgi:hypothetical protein